MINQVTITTVLVSILFLGACAPCDPNIGCKNANPDYSCEMIHGEGYTEAPHFERGEQTCAMECEAPEDCEAPGECTALSTGHNACLAQCENTSQCPAGYYCFVTFPVSYCVEQ